MDQYQVRTLSIDEMRKRLAECDATSADYHVLRRECIRRAQGWGKLANCSGCIMLCIISLILCVQWLAR